MERKNAKRADCGESATGRSAEDRGVWLAILVLAAVVAGMLTALTLVSLGVSLVAVVSAAAAAFIGLTSLGLNVLRFLLG